MIETQVFFNRPSKPILLESLWRDMAETRQTLALASAWFTDTKTSDVFISSLAQQKTAIFNAADIDRGSKRAYDMIVSYFNNPTKWEDWEDEEEYLYCSQNAYHYGVISNTDDTDARFRFLVLGNSDWQKGVMHHKFILCDNVVWTGSFNFTFQARNNYETLMRITQKEVVWRFHEELEDLVYDSSMPF